MALQGWQTQIIQYTGDGGAARTIPTAFPLDSGVVAAWIAQVSLFNPKFRHNGAGMPNTSTLGNSGYTAGMITGFTAAGLTVSNNTGGILGGVNEATRLYTAVILRDSTPDRKYMRVGTYVGLGTHGCNFTVSQLNHRRITNNNFTAADVGLAFTSISSPSGTTFILTSWTSATEATMFPEWDGNLNTPIAGTVISDNRVIITGSSPAWIPSHVWVWGRGVPYRSPQHVGDFSHDLSGEAGKTPTNQIQGFFGGGIAGGFIVGDDNNVNNVGLTYNWLAFRFNAAQLALGFFESYKIAGTAATVDRASLHTEPRVSYAARAVGASAVRRRRQPDHIGTDSVPNNGTPDDPNGGIVGHGPGLFVDLGQNIAAAGDDIYGFVFGPSYDGGGGPNPDPCPVNFPTGDAPAGSGCDAPVLP